MAEYLQRMHKNDLKYRPLTTGTWRPGTVMEDRRRRRSQDPDFQALQVWNMERLRLHRIMTARATFQGGPWRFRWGRNSYSSLRGRKHKSPFRRSSFPCAAPSCEAADYVPSALSWWPVAASTA